MAAFGPEAEQDSDMAYGGFVRSAVIHLEGNLASAANVRFDGPHRGILVSRQTAAKGRPPRSYFISVGSVLRRTFHSWNPADQAFENAGGTCTTRRALYCAALIQSNQAVQLRHGR